MNGNYTAAFSLFVSLKPLFFTSANTIQIFFNLIAFVLVFLFVPETRGRSLEEMVYTFDVKDGVSLHIHYRVKQILPWFVRHYILRQDRELIARYYGWTAEWNYYPTPYYYWARTREDMRFREAQGSSSGIVSPAPPQMTVIPPTPIESPQTSRRNTRPHVGTPISEADTRQGRAGLPEVEK